MDPRLTKAIHQGTTVVVPNATAARHLRARYARWRAQHRERPEALGATTARAAAVWPTPDVVSWGGWLARLQEYLLWDGSLGYPGEFIDRYREELIWEQVIGPDDDAGQATRLARLAVDAWETVDAWNARDLLLSEGASFGPEPAALQRWARRYEAVLAEQRWVDRAQAGRALRQAVARVSLRGRSILMFGFDALRPAERSLLRSLADRGLRVRACQPRRRPVDGEGLRHLRFADDASQFSALGDWVRDALRRHAGGAILIAPPQRVSPDSQAGRRIARALDDALVPVALLPGMSSLPRPWSFAQQGPLADQPLARSALAVLQLVRERLAADEFSSLLHEPSVDGGQQESAARALFDVWLREHGWRQVEVRELPSLLRQYGRRGRRPLLLEQALEQAQLALACARTLGIDEWVAHFRTLLQAFRWPGRLESLLQQQAADEFNTALSRLAEVAHLMPKLSAEQALMRLQRLLQAAPFQPEQGDTPVLVAALGSALAIDVDALWIPSLDALSWPPPPRPQPLLGVSLARYLGLPQASASGQRQQAHRTLRHALRGAAQVVVSSAARLGEQVRAPSPMMHALAPDPEVIHGALRRSPRLPVPAARLEPFLDERGPALGASAASDEGTTLPGLEPQARGGASVIAMQAECPFRAFASSRLAAGALPDPGQRGALRRGVLLHETLAAVWSVLEDSAGLARLLESDALESTLGEALSLERAALDRRGYAKLPSALAEVERRVVTAVLADWLRREGEREPFRVVGIEQTQTLILGGLRLSLRIDRVDEVSDGRRLVLDYKSGQAASRRRWEGPRPDAPQLPLYALALDPSPDAVAFAVLAAGAQRFVGMGAHAAVLPGLETPAEAGDKVALWSNQLAQWRATLSSLADEFARGDARVSPVRGSATCQYCELTSLCRIPGAAMSASSEEIGEMPPLAANTDDRQEQP
ncbi:MAG: PD-(D/E)XK nuclease family protein [Pseudomonadota bacterium]